MSDISLGPGWWQASDGKWYSPELHPDGPAPTDAPQSQEFGQQPPTWSSERRLRQASDGQWQVLRDDGYWYPVGPVNPPEPVGSRLAPISVIPNVTYRSGLTGVKKASGNLCFASQHVGIGLNSPAEAMVAWADIEEVWLDSTAVRTSRKSTQDGCDLTFVRRDGTYVEFQIAGMGGSEVQTFLQPLFAERGIISYLDGSFDEEDGLTNAEEEPGPSVPESEATAESLDISEPDEDSELLDSDDEQSTATSVSASDEPFASTETSAPSLADEIAKLGALHKDGILTDEEFALAKANLLNQ